MRTPPPYEPDPWPQIVSFLAWAVPVFFVCLFGLALVFIRGHASKLVEGALWIPDATQEDSVRFASIAAPYDERYSLSSLHECDCPDEPPRQGTGICWEHSAAPDGCLVRRFDSLKLDLQAAFGDRLQVDVEC